MSKANKPSREQLRLTRKGKVMLFISRFFVYLVLIFLTLLCLFFFYLMLVNSSRSNAQLQSGFEPFFKEHFFENLHNAWTDATINIPRGMWNSFVIASISAILTTYFSALTAYGVHAYSFRGSKKLHNFILVVMMIPSQVSAAGFVMLCNTLHLTNNYLPLIVPAIASPVVYFYMKQYMESVLPLELVEAARVDGANEFYTFNRIVMPIMMPAVAVQMIFSFVGSWNNFFIPAMLIDKPQKQTVPMMISTLRAADYKSFDLGKVYMLILLSILPVIVVYLLLSKFIIRGVTAGGVKG